jgi:hypothetical protein
MAEGIPVDNDIGLFFRSLGQGEWARHDTPPRVIAVTGTNGKSTTAALIAHVLEEVGTPAALAGNIGRGVLDLDPPGDGAVIVLELSSYQTELARALTPDIAVFTNLTPDHLDRHGGMGGYFAAKRRLFAEGGPDRAIIGVDEPEGRFLANQLSEGPGDGRLIRCRRASCPVRAGTSPRARGGSRNGARAARSHRSTCARCRGCRGRTTTRTPPAPMRPSARWVSRLRRSRARWPPSGACPIAASAWPRSAAWPMSTTARRRMWMRRSRRFRPSRASAGSAAGWRRKAEWTRWRGPRGTSPRPMSSGGRRRPSRWRWATSRTRSAATWPPPSPAPRRGGAGRHGASGARGGKLRPV